MSNLQQLKEEAREKLVIEIVKILAWQQAITSQGESYNGEKDWALNRILSLIDKAKEEGKAIGREEGRREGRPKTDHQFFPAIALKDISYEVIEE